MDTQETELGPLEWYCLRTQSKREHIAATLLNQKSGIEVFCPRISQIKKTLVGKKRFTEALFPSYIFARFHYESQLRLIMHSQGITQVVSLGAKRVIPDHVIEDLRVSIPEAVLEAPDLSLEPGTQVDILSGSLKGLDGTVLAQLDGKQRVEVLMDFLGREVKVEVDTDVVISKQKDGQ